MSSPFPALGGETELSVLIAQVGDTDDQLLSRMAPFVRARYEYLAGLWPQLASWYTLRDLLMIAWAQVRDAVSFTIGASVPAGGNTGVQLSDKARAIQAMMGMATGEITRLEALARASLTPQSGMLTATAPMPPPWYGIPDGNSPVFGGSLYPDTNANVPFPLSPRMGDWW